MDDWISIMLQSYCGLGVLLLFISGFFWGVFAETGSDLSFGAALTLSILGGILFVIPGLLLIGSSL